MSDLMFSNASSKSILFTRVITSSMLADWFSNRASTSLRKLIKRSEVFSAPFFVIYSKISFLFLFNISKGLSYLSTCLAFSFWLSKNVKVPNPKAVTALAVTELIAIAFLFFFSFSIYSFQPPKVV
ncbi:hypothetical protein MADP09_00691 [Mycoplasma anatis]|nr:hypothetical protein [Mycoplasmopsis anatis]